MSVLRTITIIAWMMAVRVGAGIPVVLDPPRATDARRQEGVGGRGESEQTPGGWLFHSDHVDSRRLWSQTRLLLGVGVVSVGVLYALPESVTGWDRDVSLSELPDRWWRNVSRRPIWDNDHWFFNYIGHPYCGGVYYQMARKSGYHPGDAFLYTTLMSTFMWEYGVEAFAERPSIQDLVVTPLTGWVLGEYFFHAEKRIIANQGRVMGSRTLGGVSLFFLDPISHLGEGVNRLVGREWVLTGSVALNSGGVRSDLLEFKPSLAVGLERRF